MDWLGLNYDEVDYQSKRYDRYLTLANKLLDTCYAKKKDGAIVLELPDNFNYPLNWKDNIAGEITITKDDHENANNSVLIKSDGSPAYNFASVVDDIDSGVNLIIRGVDHITNTSKQATIFKVLNSNLPEFAHVGLICNGNKPMSKRDGSSSLVEYINQGYDPDAMLNFLARLGWYPKKDDKSTSVLNKKQMIEMFFSQGKMKSSNANFDLKKLNSFDRKYKARKKENE